MTPNVTEAIEEVNLIKKVIDRTQNDFSKIANFFIFIGLINMATYLVYVVLFRIINGMNQVGYSVWVFFRGFKSVTVIGYIVLFFCYRHQLKKQNNDLSLSLINIWGTLLIGGEVFRMLFAGLDLNVRAAVFHGNNMYVGLDMIFTAVVMSVGMILLGIYLRGKGEQ